MRRAAQANWSRLPNHNPPRFYTAWTQSGHVAPLTAFVMALRHREEGRLMRRHGTGRQGHRLRPREQQIAWSGFRSSGNALRPASPL